MKPSDEVALTEEVILDYAGSLYALRQRGELRVNGVIVTPPLQREGVQIMINGFKLVSRTCMYYLFI